MNNMTNNFDGCHIINLVQDVAKQDELNMCKIKINRASGRGNGYMGVITRAYIELEDKTKRKEIISLIIKSISSSETLSKNPSVLKSFEREIYMYDKVFSAFRSFEIEKGLMPLNFGPRFYKGNILHGNKAVVLENLIDSGYVLHERRITMNEEHVAFVLRKYAHFHALSLVMRDQVKDSFDKLAAPLDDVLVKFMKEDIYNSIIHRSTKAMESLSKETDGKVIETYKKFLSEIPSYFDELINDNGDEYSVITHGDCWCNNMMFKYKNASDLTEPSDMRFLDFQMSTLTSTVIDLSYFYYVCSCKAAIDKLDHYMKLYHESVTSWILKLGGDPEKLYPYSVLVQHWKKYAKFGLIMATFVIHIMLSEEDETIDFTELTETTGTISEAFSYEIAKVQEYNDRLKHIILHFYEHDLF